MAINTPSIQRTTPLCTVLRMPFKTQQFAAMCVTFIMLSLLATSVVAEERKSPSPRVAWEDGQWVSKTPWEAKPTAIDLHFGLGTPQGYLGFSATRTLDSNFTLSMGAGKGLTGYQFSLMPKLQTSDNLWSVGFGFGPSLASYERETFSVLGDSRSYKADLVVWVSSELFLLYQNLDGFRFGMYGGATSLVYALNPNNGALPPYTLPDQGVIYPYLGLQIGKAF